MLVRLWIAVAIVCCAVTVPVRAERLVFSLSTHRVLINSSFTGADPVLFGTVEPDPGAATQRRSYDVVISVIGPREDVVTWEKQRVFGIWVNARSRTFIGVPTYLAVLSNRPLAAVTDPATLWRLQIGIDQMPLRSKSGEAADQFRAAFLRLNREHGLYLEEANAVTFLTPDLFRSSIALPANVPIGTYEIDVKLFTDGSLLTRQTSAMEIVKVGFEQFVANAAREYGLAYGLATAALALLTGWFGSVVFRRD
jgi:uncharacterized protein (TIGR02186 family)